jgi:XTP/dITP diphosphohydrolase
VHCLLIATRNSHKTREFAQILGDRYAVCDLTGSPEIPEVEETGKTLEENAVVKARSASEYLPSLVVADDSGLEVDALHGAPGIFSARYAGPQASDKENTEKLLNEIAHAEGHSTRYPARFRCVLALAEKSHLLQTFEGVAEGTIVCSPRGTAGFGYDPIFVPEGFEQTFAEMPAEVKNRISHRVRAIAQLAEYLAKREAR